MIRASSEFINAIRNALRIAESKPSADPTVQAYINRLARAAPGLRQLDHGRQQLRARGGARPSRSAPALDDTQSTSDRIGA